MRVEVVVAEEEGAVGGAGSLEGLREGGGVAYVEQACGTWGETADVRFCHCVYSIRNSGSTGIWSAVARAFVSEAMPMTARSSACCWSVRPFARAAAVWEWMQ